MKKYIKKLIIILEKLLIILEQKKMKNKLTLNKITEISTIINGFSTIKLDRIITIRDNWREKFKTEVFILFEDKWNKYYYDESVPGLNIDTRKQDEITEKILKILNGETQ